MTTSFQIIYRALQSDDIVFHVPQGNITVEAQHSAYFIGIVVMIDMKVGYIAANIAATTATQYHGVPSI